MNISIYPYELTAPAALMVGASTKRQGALLRVIFEDQITGYADCHPWTTLGDLPLSQQLEGLGHNDLTTLTERSLKIARLDAEARQQQVSLFTGLKIPPSHWLITNLNAWKEDQLQQAIQEGFKRLKLKLGKNLAEEIKQLRGIISLLPSSNKLRLDFNTALSSEQFEAFLHEIYDLNERIEFFEDPFPYEPSAWQKIQESYGVHLACDRDSDQALYYPESADVCVIKPAVQAIDPFLSNENDQRKLVVTTYLDHPLGVSSAAYIAAYAFSKAPDRISVCGLLSHYAYQPDDFSKLLVNQGPHLLAPQGYGLGFDEQLASLPWKPLVDNSGGEGQ